MKQLLILSLSAFALFFSSCSNDDFYDEIDQITRNYSESLTTSACFAKVRPADAYWYPYIPGTDEWKKLHSYKTMDEIYKICAVPKSKIRNMSTDGLLQTLFDYPYKDDYLYVSTGHEFEGFQAELKKGTMSSMYDELKSRGDRVESLLVYYRSLDLDHYENWRSGMVFYFMNLLFSLDSFCENMNQAQKKEVIKISLKKNEPYELDYTVVFLHARMMKSAKYAPFVKELERSKELKDFVDGKGFVIEILGFEEFIEKHTADFIKE